MNIFLILKGLAMGIAEIIPGVSGGTIAFITGIYERLLNAIKAWNPTNLKLLLKGKFKLFLNNVDAIFIGNLFLGMAIGMITGVFGVTYLLDHYIEPLWGFFFGLIIASVFIIIRQVKKWDLIRILLLLGGIIFAIFVISINPVDGNTSYWFVFLSGMIAISALMMPGISGSFMLLIMGMYGIIIPAFKSLITNPTLDNLFLIAVFAMGLITGLMTFSRILSWTFSKYKDSTLVVLTGFMIGSLYKIWPWRTPSQWLVKDTHQTGHDIEQLLSLTKEEYKVISEKLVLPNDYVLDDPKTILVICSMVFGFLLVYLLDKYFSKENSL